MIVIASSGGRALFPHGWHSTVQRLRLPRVWLNNCATMMPQRYVYPMFQPPPISLELKEMGGAVIVPQRSGRSYRSPLQRSGRGWRSPATAGRMAGRPIVSYGFVGIAFVLVSRLCPYKLSRLGQFMPTIIWGLY